jgi:hypothetical protein
MIDSHIEHRSGSLILGFQYTYWSDPCRMLLRTVSVCRYVTRFRPRWLRIHLDHEVFAVLHSTEWRYISTRGDSRFVIHSHTGAQFDHERDGRSLLVDTTRYVFAANKPLSWELGPTRRLSASSFRHSNQDDDSELLLR